jgi:hypothetical protein
MVLSPVSNRDWIDPAWNISTPTPEENILTSLRLKSERGRGCHNVEEPALQQFFVSATTNIVSKLSEEESAKIDFHNISSSCELKHVYVTINQCTVKLRIMPVGPALFCTESPSYVLFGRPSSGIRARILVISIMRRQVQMA